MVGGKYPDQSFKLFSPLDFKSASNNQDAKYFQSVSHHCIDDAFHKLPFGARNPNNIHFGTPGKSLHMHKLGVEKQIIEEFKNFISSQDSNHSGRAFQYIQLVGQLYYSILLSSIWLLLSQNWFHIWSQQQFKTGRKWLCRYNSVYNSINMIVKRWYQCSFAGSVYSIETYSVTNQIDGVGAWHGLFPNKWLNPYLWCRVSSPFFSTFCQSVGIKVLGTWLPKIICTSIYQNIFDCGDHHVAGTHHDPSMRVITRPRWKLLQKTLNHNCCY